VYNAGDYRVADIGYVVTWRSPRVGVLGRSGIMNQQSSYNEQLNQIDEEVHKQRAELQKHRPNILVVGRTGVGKSSLINGVLGEKVAETGAGRPITQCYATYPHRLLNMMDSVGWEGGGDGEQRFRDDTKKLLDEHRTTDPDNHIHIVWYVIAASDARFQDFDAQLVREAFGGIPVLFVLTKCDAARQEAIDQVEQAIKNAAISMAHQATSRAPAPKIVGIIRTAAEPLPILGKEPWGMVELVEATIAQLPELQRDAFAAAQAVDLALKARTARKVVHLAAMAAVGIGAIPIPFSDALLLAPAQLTMVGRIAVIYGFGMDAGSLTALIGGSMMPLVAQSTGVFLASSLIEMIPGAGSIVGGAISGIVAGGLTATIGYAFQTAFHQLAQMKAKGQTITTDAAAQYLKQALPLALQEIKQRGIKNILAAGGES
jgi:predicted GTPase/uncharacterized protein (DUF697 family)